jgi:uncharacterized protein (TIGR00369 family)
MSQLELPHTAGCFVCGRDNPLGLRISSTVDTVSGNVHTTFTPAPQHIGFESIIHGGILATVLDEVMVWSAIWASRKACVAGELSLRFVQRATPGDELKATAHVTRNRSRLIETAGEIRLNDKIICTAAAKYVPLGATETVAFIKTLVSEPTTDAAIETIRTLQAFA